MTLNSKAILNRAEITFYSWLISGMSGINTLRSKVDYLRSISQPVSEGLVETVTQNTDSIPSQTLENLWAFTKQALLPLLIWMIFGFAAGFLIGMIRPG